MAEEQKDAEPELRKGGRRRRRWPLALMMLLIAWLGFAVLVAVQAMSDLDAGRDAATAAQALSLDEVSEGRSQPHLTASTRNFDRAGTRLRSPVLAPLRVLPLMGRQLRSVEKLSSAAADASRAASAAVETALEVLGRPRPPGPERVERVRELARLASAFERRLSRIDLGSDRRLIGPIAEGRRELLEEIADARLGLRKATAAADAMADLLATPRTYLVFAANNAEMRAGSGMFLSVGTLSTGEGRLQLSGMTPVEALPVPSGVPVTGDMAERWGFLHPSEDWRNLMLSPRFDTSAALAMEMWRSIGRGEVDGVLALDPATLEAILTATGPVDAGGRTVSAENVVQELLHEQYVRYPTAVLRSERREELGDLAAAAFGRLDSGDWSPGALAAGLGQAARGRHLMLWSKDQRAQRGWEAAGIDGRVADDSLLVSLLNRGGNKLDQFLPVEARLVLRPGKTSTDGQIVVTVRNRTPAGEPPYIAGPHPALPLQPGEYLGILAATLPGKATRGRIEGVDQLTVAGADGPTRVIGTEFRLLSGGRRELVVRYRLPGSHGEVRVLPSARIPQITWRFRDQTWTDSEARTVRW